MTGSDVAPIVHAAKPKSFDAAVSRRPGLPDGLSRSHDRERPYETVSYRTDNSVYRAVNRLD